MEIALRFGELIEMGFSKNENVDIEISSFLSDWNLNIYVSATGFDMAESLKNVVDFIESPLTHLINLSFATGVFHIL